MASRVLLVDLSNITYRAVCSHSMLSHNGEETGGVYGFLQIISKLINDHAVNRIIVADDTKPYFRTRYFPNYKGNRKVLRADDGNAGLVRRAKTQIAEVLDRISIPIIACVGYEADDVIAQAIRRNKELGTRFFIASNDSDLYQLLSDDRVYVCRKAKLYERSDFQMEFGVAANAWPRVLALAGSHNGVPGIPRVGLKTAAALVRENASDRWIEHKYALPRDELQLRVRLATYPWNQPFRRLLPIAYSRVKYERRLMTAWLNHRFGIDFAPYMQSAFELLAQ